ncbi:hypothetical protein L484_017316 [Morus notabilis]|uniref:Uncharacterized protein n=1 Tax=Morus notabilis TaxID=981085 RepID=W9RSP9_9ROSA|nr:hypothetical protein L484_017316 [Morus notabilis]
MVLFLGQPEPEPTLVRGRAAMGLYPPTQNFTTNVEQRVVYYSISYCTYSQYQTQTPKSKPSPKLCHGSNPDLQSKTVTRNVQPC